MLINQFGRLDIEEEENPPQQFTYTGILDVYDHCLTEKEALELLSSFEEHNLKYEKRFLSFFNLMFQLNENNPVYVHARVPFSEVSLKNLSNTELHSILEQLKPLDIYNERIYYVGSTNQNGNRFLNGYRATQKLLNPAYKNFDKHIYFFQIWVRYSHLGEEREVPLEWLKNESLVNDIIIFLEYLFIFQGIYIGNDDGKDKRKRKTNFRPWEDYWPEGEYGIRFILDNGINSSEDRGFWPEVTASLYKEDLFKYLEDEANKMKQDSDEEMEFELVEEWE